MKRYGLPDQPAGSQRARHHDATPASATRGGDQRARRRALAVQRERRAPAVTNGSVA